MHVLGEQLDRVELQALRRAIGHVNPRHPLRSPLPVRDIVLTGLTGTIETAPRWRPTAAEAARADALIERALIGQPRLLLLDEPSTGLDIAAREQLLETMDLLTGSHPEIAWVLVTHHLEELPSSTTHALLLADGQAVAAGPALDAITSEHVSAAFRHPIHGRHDDGRWSARTARSRDLSLR